MFTKRKKFPSSTTNFKPISKGSTLKFIFFLSFVRGWKQAEFLWLNQIIKIRSVFHCSEMLCGRKNCIKKDRRGKTFFFPSVFLNHFLLIQPEKRRHLHYNKFKPSTKQFLSLLPRLKLINHKLAIYYQCQHGQWRVKTG